MAADAAGDDQNALVTIDCTQIASATAVAKCFGDDGHGKPYKTGSDKVLFDGVAYRRTFTGKPYAILQEVAATLTEYGPCDMLVTGSLPLGQDSYRVVTTNVLSFHDGAIARSKEYLQHRGGPCLFLFDYDFSDASAVAFPPGGIWAATVQAVPELAGAARLARTSMTASVRNKRTGRYATTSPRMHVYAILDDGTQLKRVARIIRNRLILAGHCYPFVSQKGTFECRAIVDHSAMAAAERIIYEGQPVLEHPDLEVDTEKRRPIVLPGGMLIASSLVDLTPDEERKVDSIIEEMSRRPDVIMEVEANKATARERQHTLSGGRYAITGEDYDRVLATGRLEGGFRIQFDDGTVATVDEIVRDIWKFQHKTLPDPLDPEYGRNKAMVLPGGRSAPIIHSYAHGGAVYQLALSAEGVAKLVAEWFETIPSSVLRPLAFQYRSSTAIPPRQWLYAGHYIRGFFSVTVAPGGTGKTSFTMVEAVAMATGRQLLHHRPHRRCRVWLFNGEDPLEEIERRLVAICTEYAIDPADLDGWLFVGSGRSQPMLLATETRDGCVINETAFDQIEAGIREFGVDVLIVDPLVSLHHIKESSNDGMGVLAGRLARLADRANIAIQVVHHVRKTGGAETTVEDSRGASATTDAARSVRALTRMTADEGKRLQVDNHRRYFRVGGDPKASMAPPPADAETNWMELKSVSLGNGTPDYPQGDSVGVVVPFTPEHVEEQLADSALREERQIIARAVLEVLAGEPEAQVSHIAAAVTPALNENGITRSKDPVVARDIITGALAGKAGVTVDAAGQLVRVRAEKRGVGPKSPWMVVVVPSTDTSDESDEKTGVFS